MVPRLCLGVLAALSAGCATRSSTATHPQIAELNHAFATVDAVTAEAIRNSDFLKRFANVEVRTTTGTRDSWTGRYLYGRQTYIEFFAPADFSINDKPAPVGAFGIALSGDRVGFNRALAARLEAAGHKPFVELDTRRFGDRTVPWFEALTAISSHGDSGARGEEVSAWAMEYQPSYFDLAEAAKEAAEGPEDVISRERYQSDLFATRMMRDVVELQFDIGPADFARVVPLLEAAGYRIRREGAAVTADGVESDLRFNLTEPSAKGLRRVRFALNRPVPRHVERIGQSTLVVGPGATAVWTFEGQGGQR
jgi:hypothetical protein